MAKTERKLSYEEFVERLPGILDELVRSHDTLLIEKDGAAFRMGLIRPGSQAGLPPTPPPDVVRQILRETAGGFHTPNREAFLQEMRDARGQDSKGRPA